MPLDPEIAQANRAATERIRAVAAGPDDRLRTPVGQHWTVGVVLAHLAFWDRRAADALARAEAAGGPFTPPEIDTVTNDLALPGWLAVPPREAGRLAIEAAEAFDAQLEAASDAAVAAVLAINPRWVRRHLHRNEHLDEADAAVGR